MRIAPATSLVVLLLAGCAATREAAPGPLPPPPASYRSVQPPAKVAECLAYSLRSAGRARIDAGADETLVTFRTLTIAVGAAGTGSVIEIRRPLPYDRVVGDGVQRCLYLSPYVRGASGRMHTARQPKRPKLSAPPRLTPIVGRPPRTPAEP